jgi:hypothetical protein
MSESQPGIYTGENLLMREEKSWSRILVGLCEKSLEFVSVYTEAIRNLCYIYLSL